MGFNKQAVQSIKFSDLSTNQKANYTFTKYLPKLFLLRIFSQANRKPNKRENMHKIVLMEIV